MANVTITKKDETLLKIVAEPNIMFELRDHYTFEVPGAKFHPKFRAKMWDGRIRLMNAVTGTLYAGLRESVLEFCRESEYTVDDQYGTTPDKVTPEQLQEFASLLNLTSDGKPIEVRDYQLAAVYQAINKGRILLLSPTASGKSLILYLLSRWHLMKKRKQLIIVPTTSLVEQMYGDFADYSSQTKWNIEKHVQRIYSGKEKTNFSDIVISTWQSIYKFPPSWFNEFDVIYGDECHLFKAKSLTGILEKATRTAFRIGTTGTLDGIAINKLVLEGLFGCVYKVTTTKELMDKKQLAELSIKAIVLDYNDKDRQAAKKLKEYAAEVDFLVHHTRRNKFLVNLATSRTGNTLLLFQKIEHGKALYEAIKEKVGEKRKVFLVYGAVATVDREQVRKLTELQSDAIIVASNGTFSTGINIKRLHNIIFGAPSKSRIRTLQSIGRGLRTAAGKHTCELYDVGDDLSWKSWKNHTLKHLAERIKLYNEEKFNYWIGRVPLAVK